LRKLSLIGAPFARLLGLAFGIAFAMALQIAAGRGVLNDFLFKEEALPIIFIVILLTFGCAASILSTFTATLRHDQRRVTATIAFVALTLGTAIHAGHSQNSWPLVAYFGVFAFTWVVYGFTSLFTFVSLMNVQRKVAWTAATGMAAIYTLVCSVGFFARSWIGLSPLSRAVPLIRDISIGLVILILVGTLFFYKPFQLNAKNRLAGFKLRLPEAKDSPLLRTAFLLSLGGIALNVFLDALYITLDYPLVYDLGLVPWSWIGIFFLTVGELSQISGELRTGTLSARLTPKAAHRLLARYEPGRDNWAATVGIKTANFVIDHDPSNYLVQKLPATILNIRADEIQKSIAKILEGMELVNRSQGSRLVGALDAEFSLRPCVDILLMYACLYMDIGPLVERRIKVLGTLFPIIDPTLTSRINASDLGHMMRRQEWLFYLDYAWTDQHLIASSVTTRFDVSISSVGLKERFQMIEVLQRNDSVGAQVWLSPEARDRLIQEAPQLRSIIRLSPIENQNGDGDTLLFCIRFEHLIPMLQRYFELDKARRNLLDFEPSQTHSRMLNLVSLQLSRATNTAEIMEVLTSISTIPWNGYKEKDAALKLILKAHERLRESLSPDKPLHLSESKEAKAALEFIQDTVQKVGYPSQMLHRAQMAKMALRQVPQLLEAACSPYHRRFIEAWLLLSSIDYKTIDPSQRKNIAQFLNSVPKRNIIGRNPLVQAKSVDTWSGLCRVAGPDTLGIYKDVLKSLWTWFIQARVGLNMVSHLIDAQVFAMSIHGDLMSLDPDLQSKVDLYISQEIASLDPSHSLVLAIMGRLQSIKSRKAAVA
jgi:hypothetical protein